MNSRKTSKNRQSSYDYHSNYLHQQAQLDKQKVEQKIDLEYNIDFLGRALSKIEIYAFRFGNQFKLKDVNPLFGFYNRFNNGYKFEKTTLFKSLINAVKFVDIGFEETESKYKEILFPENMKKEEVIEYIEFLKSCLNSNEERSIYQKFIDVIERQKTDFSCYQKLYEKNPKINPEQLMNKYPQMHRAFDLKERYWRNQIENVQNYRPMFKLNQKFEDDPVFKYNLRNDDVDEDMK